MTEIYVELPINQRDFVTVLKRLNYVNKVKLVLEVAIMFYNIFIFLLKVL